MPLRLGRHRLVPCRLPEGLRDRRVRYELKARVVPASPVYDDQVPPPPPEYDGPQPFTDGPRRERLKAEYDRLNGRPALLSAATLQTMEFPPAKAYIDGLVLEGLTVLGGKPKLGKSWWALRAAIAISTGGVAFGNPARSVTGARVLYLALEDGNARLQDRLGALSVTAERWPADLTTTTAWPRFDASGLDLWAETDRPGSLRGGHHRHNRRVRKPRHGKGDAYQEDTDALAMVHDLTRERPGLAVVLPSTTTGRTTTRPTTSTP